MEIKTLQNTVKFVGWDVLVHFCNLQETDTEIETTHAFSMLPTSIGAEEISSNASCVLNTVLRTFPFFPPGAIFLLLLI